ncbi:MAG: hypothetical protein AB1523_08255 [Bacillota bacterium]
MKTRNPETRTCATCAKRASDRRCHVLVKMIGKTRPCFAWTDDPDWAAKVRAAVAEYENRRAACA